MDLIWKKVKSECFFTFFIIYLMQAQQLMDCRLEEVAMQSNFFGQLIPMEDCKSEVLIYQEKTLDNLDQVDMKKKGRPKGEKNSQKKDRKGKSFRSENTHTGHWQLTENRRYHWFLEIHHLHFIKKEMRRLDKIFKSMSTFIGTREAEQCRSHHQKMEKKFHSFSKILMHLRHEHYRCQSTDNLLLDLMKQQEVIPNILSIQELKELEERNLSESSQKYEGYNITSKQYSAKVNQVVSFDNILGDNYQQNFGLEFMIGN